MLIYLLKMVIFQFPTKHQRAQRAQGSCFPWRGVPDAGKTTLLREAGDVGVKDVDASHVSWLNHGER